MGNIKILIEGKPLKYKFDFDGASSPELSKSLGYLEIIKKKLVEEIEKKEKNLEQEEN